MVIKHQNQLHLVWILGIEFHSNIINLGIYQLSQYGFMQNIFVYYY
jgi:hypothetical protein